MADNTDEAKQALIKAGVEIVKTAYDDALKPVSEEAGKALGTIGKTVNVALAPLRGIIWSWEGIEDYIVQTVGRKLSERDVPDNRIQTPDLDIAVPAIEALRYSKLKENYANLLATSMDQATAIEGHPAYVEILKQLTPDEIKILEFLPVIGRIEPLVDLGFTSPKKGSFVIHRHIGTIGEEAGCEMPELVPKHIDNLCRLGLTEIPPLTHLSDDLRYDSIRNLKIVNEVKEKTPEGNTFDFSKKCFGLTMLGDSFINACVDKPRKN